MDAKKEGEGKRRSEDEEWLWKGRKTERTWQLATARPSAHCLFRKKKKKMDFSLLLWAIVRRRLASVYAPPPPQKVRPSLPHSRSMCVGRKEGKKEGWRQREGFATLELPWMPRKYPLPPPPSHLPLPCPLLWGGRGLGRYLISSPSFFKKAAKGENSFPSRERRRGENLSIYAAIDQQRRRRRGEPTPSS